VVDKSKKSKAQLQAERELFWYRDDLLKTLSVTWLEVSLNGLFGHKLIRYR